MAPRPGQTLTCLTDLYLLCNTIPDSGTQKYNCVCETGLVKRRRVYKSMKRNPGSGIQYSTAGYNTVILYEGGWEKDCVSIRQCTQKVHGYREGIGFSLRPTLLCPFICTVDGRDEASKTAEILVLVRSSTSKIWPAPQSFDESTVFDGPDMQTFIKAPDAMYFPSGLNDQYRLPYAC